MERAGKREIEKAREQTTHIVVPQRSPIVFATNKIEKWLFGDSDRAKM